MKPQFFRKEWLKMSNQRNRKNVITFPRLSSA